MKATPVSPSWRRSAVALLLLGGLGYLGATAAAMAQDPRIPSAVGDRQRQADENACRPDVFRLCQAFIPDEGRIVACLTAKRVQLSPACRTVFSRDTAAKTSKARKSKRNRPKFRRST